MLEAGTLASPMPQQCPGILERRMAVSRPESPVPAAASDGEVPDGREGSLLRRPGAGAESQAKWNCFGRADCAPTVPYAVHDTRSIGHGRVWALLRITLSRREQARPAQVASAEKQLSWPLRFSCPGAPEIDVVLGGRDVNCACRETVESSKGPFKGPLLFEMCTPRQKILSTHCNTTQAGRSGNHHRMLPKVHVSSQGKQKRRGELAVPAESRYSYAAYNQQGPAGHVVSAEDIMETPPAVFPRPRRTRSSSSGTPAVPILSL